MKIIQLSNGFAGCCKIREKPYCGYGFKVY
jgi:hypothetical protein